MKRPAMKFDTQALLGWLLRYGDKIVLALVVAVTAWLAWQGIEGFRIGGTREDERPDAIAKLAGAVQGHINNAQRLPPGELPDHTPLAAIVQPWLKPNVGGGASGVMNNPLFSDFSKRTEPQVFPVEDVQAVAGIGVVAAKPPAGAARSPDEAAPPPPATAVGKLTPYVIVTALLPVAKQEADYRRRFKDAGHQDPARDTPVWLAYRIERAEVGPQGPGNWKTVLTGTVGADVARSRDWAGIAQEDLPANVLLPTGGRTPNYCGPLPRLAEGAWGQDALHPALASRFKSDPASPSSDVRMLRYYDDDVEPTATYTYRVTHSLANPNFNDPDRPETAIHPKDLENPESAKARFLLAPVSAASRPVTVPVATRILAAVIPRGQRPEIRNWKPGWLEIMILGPSTRGRGARALRTLVTEPGGMANVDEKTSDSRHPKLEMRRSKGEDIVTNQLLLDVRGSLEERGGIQEPYELLFRRPDGGFEWVTAAASEPLIERYKHTLPTGEETKPDEIKPPDGGKPTAPKVSDPFSKPKDPKK